MGMRIRERRTGRCVRPDVPHVFSHCAAAVSQTAGSPSCAGGFTLARSPFLLFRPAKPTLIHPKSRSPFRMARWLCAGILMYLTAFVMFPAWALSGPAADPQGLEARRSRRPAAVRHFGVVLGGRLGYGLFYKPGYRQSAGNFRRVAGRHGLSRRSVRRAVRHVALAGAPGGRSGG